jgi:hypothetical protein
MKAQKKTGGTGSRKLRVRRQPIRDLRPSEKGARQVKGGLVGPTEKRIRLEGLVERLRAVRSELGATAGARALRHAGTVTGLLGWTRRALGRAHLVDVVSALQRELNLGVEELRALRLPVDLLEAFPGWRAGSRAGFSPRGFGLRLVPERAARPIGSVRLQISPLSGGAPIVLTLLRDLARGLDPAVRIVVLVDPEADPRPVRRLAREALGRHRRIRFVTADFLSLFARDNALAALDGRGRPALLIPRALRTEWDSGAAPLDAKAAERALGVRVVRSRLCWRGGNILYDGEHLVVGADTVDENVTRLGLAPGEVTALLRAELGEDVAILGDPSGARFDDEKNCVVPSGQASYHLDLDVALLGRTGPEGRPTALLADPDLGLELLPEMQHDPHLVPPHFLPEAGGRRAVAAEYRAAARHRRPQLRAYRKTLERLGYRVVGIPELRTNWRDALLACANLDFTYANVLPGLNRGRPAVHYLPWGMRALDEAAEKCFRQADLEPIPIASTPYLANAMMGRFAGLRCFCGAMP